MNTSIETSATSTLFDVPSMERGAVMAARHRYLLTRIWDKATPPVCFIMLNPSTADHHRDDPTIKRCMGFARRWGHGGIQVVNLFAYRATDPKELYMLGYSEAVGPFNQRYIAEALPQ